MITNTGLNLVRDLIGDIGVTAPSHMAVGTNNTAESETDTALGAEAHRNALGTSQQGATGIITLKMTLLSTQANGNSLKEVGVLNAASGGTLLDRITHTQIDKTSLFEQRYQIQIKIKRS